MNDIKYTQRKSVVISRRKFRLNRKKLKIKHTNQLSVNYFNKYHTRSSDSKTTQNFKQSKDKTRRRGRKDERKHDWFIKRHMVIFRT